MIDKPKIKWNQKWFDDKSGYWIETQTPFGPMYVDCWDGSKRYVAYYFEDDNVLGGDRELGTRKTLDGAKNLIYKHLEKRIKEVVKYSKKVGIK